MLGLVVLAGLQPEAEPPQLRMVTITQYGAPLGTVCYAAAEAD